MKIKDIPVGGRLRDRRSGFDFLIAAKDHPGYNGVPVVCEQVIKCACFDAAEPDTPGDTIFDRVRLYGSNDYEKSNIHAWLNSGGTYWYRPSHPTDTPPAGRNLRYDEQPTLDVHGFLHFLRPEFADAIIEQDVTVLVRTGKEKGELTTVKARVFLPSRTELGMGNESGFAEGAPLPLFEGRANLRAKPTQQQMQIYGRSWNPGFDLGLRCIAPMDNAQLFDPKHSWWYWCRTPHLAYAYLVRVMSANGAFSYTMAYNDMVGVRPMMALNPDTELDDEGCPVA